MLRLSGVVTIVLSVDQNSLTVFILYPKTEKYLVRKFSTFVFGYYLPHYNFVKNK